MYRCARHCVAVAGGLGYLAPRCPLWPTVALLPPPRYTHTPPGSGAGLAVTFRQGKASSFTYCSRLLPLLVRPRSCHPVSFVARGDYIHHLVSRRLYMSCLHPTYLYPTAVAPSQVFLARSGITHTVGTFRTHCDLPSRKALVVTTRVTTALHFFRSEVRSGQFCGCSLK